MPFPAERLRARALALGFNLVGLARAAPSPWLDAYLRWLDQGMYGEMAYMGGPDRPDRVARRRDLNVILPGARSVVVVGLDYHGLNIPAETLNDPSRGRIAAYAWGFDYHDVMTPRLEDLAAWLCTESSNRDIKHRVYVDTGAVLERGHGQQAGLGFIGKNTMLIHPRRGSYFFLGEILTDLEFGDYDKPVRITMCGTCNRCRTACPTDAFPEPYVLDARRCISYLTIELKGTIDRTLRPLMGNWIMGCDVCQDVCPFNRFAQPATESAFLPVDLDRAAPPLLDLLQLDEAGFAARFAESPVERLKRDRLVRNACVAAGNWGNRRAVPSLLNLLHDRSALVRGHAAWALSRIAHSPETAQDTRLALQATLKQESEPGTQAELSLALETFG